MVDSVVFSGGVVGNWVGFVVINSVYVIIFYIVFVDQYVMNGVGMMFGQFLVVSVGVDGVGVIFNGGGSGWVLFYEVSQVFDVSVVVFFDFGFVEVEFYVQLYVYDFGDSWVVVGVNGDVGWGIWVFVDVVVNVVVVGVGVNVGNWFWSWSGF